MIRIVVTVADAGMAANVGGPVQVRMRTFDVECVALETLLTDNSNSYREAHVSGVEVLPAPPDEKENHDQTKR